jgi:hypothetical protein
LPDRIRLNVLHRLFFNLFKITTQMKFIAVIDLEWQGHHAGHLKYYAKTLLELGHRIVVFCPNPVELREWIVSHSPKQAHLCETFELLESSSNSFPIGRIRRTLITLTRWRQAAIAIKQYASKIGQFPELTIFPWIDSYLAPYITHHTVDRIFPYNWIGTYHLPQHLRIKQKFEFIRRGWLNSDSVLYSPHCLAVAVHDEGILDLLQQKLHGKPIVFFPNIIDESLPNLDSSLVKQIQEKARGRKIIGSLGSQGKRKGLLTLIEVIQNSQWEECFFLIAGEFAPHTFNSQELKKIYSFINSKPENCFFHLERIADDREFNAVATVCDILFVVYDNQPFNSQMLNVATKFEKPVLAQDSYCIGERVKKFNLGLTVSSKNISQCVETLYHLVKQIDSKQLQPDFENYNKLHSLDQLRQSLEKIVSIN